MKMLPWKSSPPCGIPDHHIHIAHKIKTGLHHSTGSCDQETTWPNSRGSVHIFCFSCHQPVIAVQN